MKEQYGAVVVPYKLIQRLHAVRARIAPDGEKLFLKDVVMKALTEFLEKHEK